MKWKKAVGGKPKLGMYFGRYRNKYGELCIAGSYWKSAGKYIAVCGGDMYPADSPKEARRIIEALHALEE